MKPLINLIASSFDTKITLGGRGFLAFLPPRINSFGSGGKDKGKCQKMSVSDLASSANFIVGKVSEHSGSPCITTLQEYLSRSDNS